MPGSVRLRKRPPAPFADRDWSCRRISGCYDPRMNAVNWRAGWTKYLCVVLLAAGPMAPGSSGQEKSAAEAGLYTNVYQVPPTFLNVGGSSGKVSKEDSATVDSAGETTKKDGSEAMKMLQNAGITFGEGASAIYQVSGSQLIVRNTLEQMELVEAYVESFKSSAKKQILVTVLYAESDESLLEGPTIGETHEEGRRDGERPGAGGMLARVASQPEMASLLAEHEVAQAARKRQAAAAKKRAEPTAIMDEEKFQAALKKWRKSESWNEADGGHVVLRSGQGNVVLAVGERGVGVIDAVIGADATAVSLLLMVQGAPDDGSEARDLAIADCTPWAGRTLAFARKLPDGRHQYDFVTVEIIGPDGKPARSADDEPVVFKPKPGSDTEITIGDQEDIKKADELALKGNQLMSDGQYSQARKMFARAINVLPDFPDTQDRQHAYLSMHYSALRAAGKAKREQ